MRLGLTAEFEYVAYRFLLRTKRIFAPWLVVVGLRCVADHQASRLDPLRGKMGIESNPLAAEPMPTLDTGSDLTKDHRADPETSVTPSVNEKLPIDDDDDHDEEEVSEELTPAERRVLKLKCSLFMTLVPGMSFSLQWLDKSCVASAAVMGIRKDLGMKGDQYSWTTSGT